MLLAQIHRSKLCFQRLQQFSFPSLTTFWSSMETIYFPQWPAWLHKADGFLPMSNVLWGSRAKGTRHDQRLFSGSDLETKSPCRKFNDNHQPGTILYFYDFLWSVFVFRSLGEFLFVPRRRELQEVDERTTQVGKLERCKTWGYCNSCNVNKCSCMCWELLQVGTTWLWLWLWLCFCLDNPGSFLWPRSSFASATRTSARWLWTVKGRGHFFQGFLRSSKEHGPNVIVFFQLEKLRFSRLIFLRNLSVAFCFCELRRLLRCFRSVALLRGYQSRCEKI